MPVLGSDPRLIKATVHVSGKPKGHGSYKRTVVGALNINGYTYTYIYTYVYMYVYVRVYIYICIRNFTYTYTYMLGPERPE